MNRMRVRLHDDQRAQLALTAEKLGLSWNQTVALALDVLADDVRAGKVQAVVVPQTDD
jgi:hypothetical protein